MWITDRIFSLIWDISDHFLDAFLEVRTWVWPFSLLQYPLFALRTTFFSLLTPIADLGVWLDDVEDQISGVLSLDAVLSILDPWLKYAEDSWTWISGAWWNIWSVVEDWWTSTSLTVIGWIDSAIAGAETLINQVAASLATLQTTWDNFWTLTWPSMVADLGGLRSSWDAFMATTLPGLISSSGAQTLINSTLTTWFPFYDDLVDTWEQIALFFTNPLDYLAARFETWFWGETV